jgi:hypothetical protein
MKGHAHRSLDVTGIVERGIILKQCPITSGRPTRMTAAWFARACERERATGLKYCYNFGKTKTRGITRWCDQQAICCQFLRQIIGRNFSLQP